MDDPDPYVFDLPLGDGLNRLISGTCLMWAVERSLNFSESEEVDRVVHDHLMARVREIFGEEILAELERIADLMWADVKDIP